MNVLGDYNLLKIIKLAIVMVLLIAFIFDNYRFNRKYRIKNRLNRKENKNKNKNKIENSNKSRKNSKESNIIVRFLRRIKDCVIRQPFNFSSCILFISILTCPVSYNTLIIQAAFFLIWIILSYLLFGKNIEKDIKLPRLFKRKKLGKTKVKTIHFYNDSLGFYYILPIIMFVLSYTIGYYISYGMYSLIITFQVVEIELALVIIALIIYLLGQLLLLLKMKIKTKETFKYCIGMMNRGECKVLSFYPFMFLPFLGLVLL